MTPLRAESMVALGALLLGLSPLVANAQRAPSAGPAASSPPAVATSTPTPSREALAAALASYGNEPGVDRVVQWAMSRADTDPGASQRARRRGRLSGLLPTLRLGARRGLGRDASSQLATDSTRLSTAADLSLEATLNFRLDHLLYGPDEVAWSRERRSQALYRDELIRDVVSIYFRRRRLMLERDLLGARSVERIVAIEELSALLDELTGGAFSRHVL